MATTAQMESFAEKALRETRAFMGTDASLLKYLPIDKIREAKFEDKKHERPNSLPLRILFGQLQEGDKRGEEVWILLYKAHTEDRWPEQRFNIFDATGRLLGSISIEDAVRQTNAANAFKWLKAPGSMDTTQLRAVIKYYFMIKKVEPLMPWPVDARFASQLTAACKVARKSAENVANTDQMEKDRESAANAISQTRLFTASQAAKTNASTNGLKAGANSTLTRAQSVSHRSSARIASTQPTRTRPFDDSSSLFFPEQPRRPATPLGYKSQASSTASKSLFSESEHVEEYKRAFQSRMLPQSTPAPRSPPSDPRTKRQSLPVHQDASKASDTTPSMASKPVPGHNDANGPLASNVANQQKEHNANNQLHITFVSAYRKADEEGELYMAKLHDNNTKIREVKAEIAVLETQVRDLEVEARNLKAKHKDIQMSKKRLHDELAPESRELLRFGAEIAQREFKRAKTDNHEHVEGDEWKITQELGCGQKD